MALPITTFLVKWKEKDHLLKELKRMFNVVLDFYFLFLMVYIYIYNNKKYIYI